MCIILVKYFLLNTFLSSTRFKVEILFKILELSFTQTIYILVTCCSIVTVVFGSIGPLVFKLIKYHKLILLVGEYITVRPSRTRLYR